MKKAKIADKTGRVYSFLCAFILILLTLSVIVFLAFYGTRIFTHDKISITQFLFGLRWNPAATRAEGGPYVGILIFIAGSLAVSLTALLISTPISISAAVYMAEISPKWMRSFLQAVVELFAGIPSVVYGWIGLSVLVPFIRNYIGGLGFSLLAGTIVLGVMIFPTITSVTTDRLKSLPNNIKEASYALGATRWQTIKNVLLPAAVPGILTAIVLGLARAFGEALAVQMVIGNSIRLPSGLLNPIHTMTSILTMDMGNTVSGSVWNDALWSIAFLLLIFSFIFITVIRMLGKRGQYR